MQLVGSPPGGQRARYFLGLSNSTAHLLLFEGVCNCSVLTTFAPCFALMDNMALRGPQGLRPLTDSQDADH